MRRDTAVLRTSITVTAGALAALAALTACGPVRMGSAAIAGGSGISAATLASEVNDLQRAVQASNGSIQLQFPRSQMPQQVLSWLIRFRVRDQVAARNGVTISPAQSQQALASISTQAEQNQVKLADLAAANGLPPDMLPDLGRYQAVQDVILRRLDGGTMPSSQTLLQILSQKFNAVQCRAAKSLNIVINPQYGRFDYSGLAVVAAPQTLSAPAPGEASPSPSSSVQATPSC